MRKLIMLAAMLFIAAIPAHAQGNYPVAEIFGGYSYLSFDTGAGFGEDIGDFFDNREGFHGVGFSVAGNLSRHFGIVGDFSYHRKTQDIGITDLKTNKYYFLFGPRVYARGHSVTGFAHALVGGTRTKLTSDDFQGADLGSRTDFALGFGGGVDVNVTDSIGIRLFQLDYIPVRTEGSWFHDLRAQVGITFRIQ
ncbi:MAG TPA: outer membrane beta-barrel protein [Blastocatellia bacterium]|jgi:opacity protein-like surface antigen